jgi:N-acetyl sugar amidotransferase
LKYTECSRCVLGIHDDPSICFNLEGICSYCLGYDEKAKKVLFPPREAQLKLEQLLTRIKVSGQGKKYDSIMGVSGGVDSTYLAWKAKEWGLRPLLVHLDNGWNSELSVVNIENIIARTGFDLFTHVVEWEEFKDIQLSFFKAHVVDIELVSDHAIFTTLYDLALRQGIKYMLSGRNLVTEEILPKNWIHNKGDSVNIMSIHKKFGTRPFKTYPLLTPAKKLRALRKRIQSVNLLDLVDYRKKEVKDIIIRELGWKDYGGKHYESIFTRFYQGYILPKKFGIDKRKAHLSNLICSGQLTREKAILELDEPIYDPKVLKTDYTFVLKKLGFTPEEFENYIRAPRKEHSDYGVEKNLLDTFPILKFLYKIKRRILN